MSGESVTTDFPLVEQGYDPNQVDQYLATQMLQLREEVDAARTHIIDLEDQLATAREAEEALRLTMVLAKRASDDIIAKAQADADEILGEARREAFVLMTEARDDTDTALDQGKAIIAEARQEALSIVADVEAETARLIAERDATLNQLREKYEAESSTLIDRINTLRSIANDLDAKNSGQPAPSPTHQDPPSPTNEGRTADAPQPGIDTDHDRGAAPSAEKIRESFSGRRSAKLPRIGEEAGRNALAAATAMRSHLTHEPDDSDQPGEDDLAVRTA